MKISSNRIGNTNLLLIVNLVAFVVLLNVLLIALQGDLRHLSSSLDGLQNEVHQQTFNALTTIEKNKDLTQRSVHYPITTFSLPAHPFTFTCFLLLW